MFPSGPCARAATWETKERLDLAATELRGAVQLEPDNLEYPYALGRTYQEMEHWDDVHRAFEEAPRIAPGHGPTCTGWDGAPPARERTCSGERGHCGPTWSCRLLTRP